MYNVDGFNERTIYIKNANDRRALNNSIKNNNMQTHDSSFAQMKINENRPDIETAKKEERSYIEQPKGDKENFVVQNYNINHVNDIKKMNAVNNALNRNRFKKF